MNLKDLFCGGGGCSVGYHRAGFNVSGVDIQPHPDYPYPMLVDDAMAWLDRLVRGKERDPDVAHVSPPCQRYTRIQTGEGHPDLVGPVRDLLTAWGGPYVIENVVGAPMRGAVLYCGEAFGLGATCADGVWRPLKRHRLFESNLPLMSPGCACSHRQAVGVYGHGGHSAKQKGYNGNAAESREAMGIDWMKHYDVVQAIPPAYTEHVGFQLLARLGVEAA